MPHPPMPHDNPPGTLTPDDLREALRTNRALLSTAQGDLTCHQARIEACHERIAIQQMLIDQWNHLAETAPERITTISATIARQEAHLADLVAHQRTARRDAAAERRDALNAALAQLAHDPTNTTLLAKIRRLAQEV